MHTNTRITKWIYNQCNETLQCCFFFIEIQFRNYSQQIGATKLMTALKMCVYVSYLLLSSPLRADTFGWKWSYLNRHIFFPYSPSIACSLCAGCVWNVWFGLVLLSFFLPFILEWFVCFKQATIYGSIYIIWPRWLMLGCCSVALALRDHNFFDAFFFYLSMLVHNLTAV